jgi:hypothetical protein
MQHLKCAANHHANCQPTAKPWSAQHQISIHLNFVSGYRGVKAKNEGVFDWLIRKKRKEKKRKEKKRKKKKKKSQYFYDLEDKVDSKRDGMLRAVIVR